MLSACLVTAVTKLPQKSFYTPATSEPIGEPPDLTIVSLWQTQGGVYEHQLKKGPNLYRMHIDISIDYIGESEGKW